MRACHYICYPHIMCFPSPPLGRGYPIRGFFFCFFFSLQEGGAPPDGFSAKTPKWPKMAKNGPKNGPKMRKKCKFAQKSKNARFLAANEGRQDFKKGVAPLFGAPGWTETGGKFSGNFRILGGPQNREKWPKMTILHIFADPPPVPKNFFFRTKLCPEKCRKIDKNGVINFPQKMALSRSGLPLNVDRSIHPKKGFFDRPKNVTTCHEYIN